MRIALVGIDHQRHLIGCGSDAVVVLVPHNHDRVPTSLPGRGTLDGDYKPSEGHVALIHQGWVQPCESTVIGLVIVASRTGGGTIPPMLVIALVGHNVHKAWQLAAR